jgi:hypothetical protein
LSVKLYPAPKVPYRCSVYASVSLTIPNAAFTGLLFDTVIADPNNNYAPGTGLYTVPVAGLYLVTASVLWSAVAASTANLLSLFKNATEYRRGYNAAATGGGMALSAIATCALGDTLGISASQTSGGSGTTTAGPVNTWADIHLLSYL